MPLHNSAYRTAVSELSSVCVLTLRTAAERRSRSVNCWPLESNLDYRCVQAAARAPIITLLTSPELTSPEDAVWHGAADAFILKLNCNIFSRCLDDFDTKIDYTFSEVEWIFVDCDGAHPRAQHPARCSIHTVHCSLYLKHISTQTSATEITGAAGATSHIQVSPVQQLNSCSKRMLLW